MDYEHCLFISDQPIDITGAVLQSEYRVKSDKYAAKSVEIANKPTYRHLYLYHLKSYDSFEKVLKSLKKENKSNVKVIWHI
jgi:effector-binding domain-containing protein